jgi:hypothetical protein
MHIVLFLTYRKDNILEVSETANMTTGKTFRLVMKICREKFQMWLKKKDVFRQSLVIVCQITLPTVLLSFLSVITEGSKARQRSWFYLLQTG